MSRLGLLSSRPVLTYPHGAERVESDDGYLWRWLPVEISAAPFLLLKPFPPYPPLAVESYHRELWRP
jgi:hypothetical protein